MKNNTLIRIVVVLLIYLGLKYFGGHYGRMILYPITLLVTFLHEFGHALGALITGGEVDRINISQDGSGFTVTRGGSKAIILMGGYIGSAILGNLLFYIGVRKEKLAQWTLMGLALLMAAVGLLKPDSMFTLGVLLVFAVAFFLLARYTAFDREIIMFLGLATILYIIQDFNVGPRSDLEQYAQLFVLIPAQIWMYVWLIVVVLLFFFNIRMIFRKAR